MIHHIRSARSRKIALDAMGGDFGVHVNVAGAVHAAKLLGVETVLVGEEGAIRESLSRLNVVNLPQISIVHAPDVVSMDEHPSTSVRKKSGASINVAFDLLLKGDVGAVVSAGNSGAMMTAAILKAKRIPGIERPAIAITMSTLKGSAVALDMGANVDCRPSHLVQFAIMGEVYARVVQGKRRPTVGLLSNGTEESKGNELTRAANEILKTLDIHYKGYLEGRDVFRGMADVIVCDGFVGNVVLKSVEGFVDAGIEMFKREFNEGCLSRLGLALFYAAYRKRVQAIRRKYDYAEYGAAPLLGVNAIGLVCHGSSTARAIKNALSTARAAVESEFLEKLTAELTRMAVGV